MGTALLPLKYSLVKYMEGKASVTAKDLFKSLQHNYKSEKQLSMKNIEKHLDALRAAGLIEMVNVELNGSGELKCSYKLTEYGQSRLKKYIPEG